MSSFLRSRSGQIAQSLTLVTIVVALAAGLMSVFHFLTGITKKKIQITRGLLETSSAVETMVLAYRLAEIKYVDALAGCDTANPFLRALKSGAGCNIDVTVFDPADATDAGLADGLYVFPAGGGCRITAAASTCATGSHELMDMPMTLEGRDVATAADTYRFFLNNVVPERQIAEVTGILQHPKTQSKFAFAIRASLTNAAHLEADGRVTQENPDPLAYCQGQKQWADFLVYNPAQRKCTRFAQLGGGTGLAFYRGRYFGFRPFDGQVIDLLAASDAASTSYLVDETGKLDGTPVFPPYSKDPLINVDDITVVGRQIYYVALGSADAHIGALTTSDGVTFDRLKLCPAGQSLGDLGWGQSYEGIGALSSSTPLIKEDGDGLSIRFATFFLKTSGGDLLTAVIRGTAAGAPYQCFVFKDADLQQIEYRRTNGFDRTDNTKPYFLY